MIRLTLVGRVSDGMPLSSSVEPDEAELKVYRDVAKRLLKTLRAPPNRVTVESARDPFFFHCLLAGPVAFVAVCERNYPVKLAFHYLSQLQEEVGVQKNKNK
jgi:vesicle transport protein SEC22